MKGAEVEKNFASAVIYVHNAENRLAGFLRVILQLMDQNFEHAEVICVNDHSTDRSLEVIREISREAAHTSVSVVNMSYFHGQELAMNAGMDLAIGDFVFEFDNTVLDFDPSVVMEIYRRSLEGYDIVSAVPDRRERFSSHLFYHLFERYSEIPCSMSTESFRVLSRRVINRISSMNKTVPYRKALYANCGLQTDSIRYAVQPVVEMEDWQNENGAKISEGAKAETSQTSRLQEDPQERHYRFSLAADSLILFTAVGYRFSMTMTVAMMLVSIFMVLYSVVTYLIYHPVEGWTTTILFLSVAFFGLFGILTVIVKYLQLLVNMVFRRKHYSFENVEKLV